MAIKVKLLPNGTTPNPLRTLYVAYRVAYSSLTPMQIVERIEADRITEAQMLTFIEERLATGHASPLQQISFEFGISGVSRAFSHQFVRHRVGLEIEQQSQRYVSFEGKRFPYTVPPSVIKAGYEDAYRGTMAQLQTAYDGLVHAGVPAEDARFVLPNATNTNLKVMVNFGELQHICDLRLCTRAQWEIRIVASKLRGEVNRLYPWLGNHLAIKCMAQRLGYCDEDLAAYQACPVSRLRPHKSMVVPV